MIDFEKWNKAVDDADTFCNVKTVRITETDGEIFEGICKGYYEDENSYGEACWAIGAGQRKFLQEDVEKIEFID